MGWTFTSFTFETQERPAAHRHTWPGCGERFSGRAVPAAGLSAAEKLAYEQLVLEYAKGIGYGYQMGLRPRAIYGIADSPVGIAAYFLDHGARRLREVGRGTRIPNSSTATR
jgi:nucleoside-diphosphate-sugar epimerase